MPSASVSSSRPPPLFPEIALAQIVLKPRKARPFYGRHPWVLDSAVEGVEGSPADGQVVDLLSDKGKFIARGVFNSQSRIRVRLYAWNPAQELDEAFWCGRIAAALRLRKDIGYDDPQGAARLVFSEADGLSGLIVDRYGPHLSIQVTALAMAVRLKQIVPFLVGLTGAESVVLRTERGIGRAEGLDLRDGPYWGTPPDGPILIQEHGLQFAVDLAEGQKTGLYLDQRENRLAAASYFRGRRVLDMFCYTGGFSLAATVGGAERRWASIPAPRPSPWPKPTPSGTASQGRDFRPATASKLCNRCCRRASDSTLSFSILPSSHTAAARWTTPCALSLVESIGGRFARSRRNPGHVQLLRTRRPRGLPHDAPGRGPTDPPRYPDSPGARGRARPSRGRHLPGRRLLEVFRLPRWRAA